MKKRTKINIVFFLIIVIAQIIIFTYKKDRGKDILKSPKFTVGVISSEWHSKTTLKQPGFDFKYSINLKESQAVTNQIKIAKIGEKYLVAYDSIKPNAVSFLSIYPLPDSIEPPPNGWRLDEVPIEVDWKKIEEYILNR